MSRLIVGFAVLLTAYAAQATWTYYSWGGLRDSDGKWNFNVALDEDGNVIIRSQGSGSYTYDTVLDFEEIERDIGRQIVELVALKPVTLEGKVYLPHVKKIGAQCFLGCKKITEIEAPELVYIADSVNNGVFKNCSALTKISFPKLEYVGAEAFYSGCKSLSDLGNLSKVKHIGGSAFRETTALSGDIYLESLTNLMDSAFRESNIITFEAPQLLHLAGTVFYNCHKLTDVQMPSVLSVGSQCFYASESVTNVVMGSVVTLASQAFRQMTGLERVVLGNSVTNIPEGLFLYSNNIKIIEPFFPKSLISMAESSYAGRSYLSGDVVFDCPSMTTIPAKTFQNCTQISNIVIKTPVTAIGESAFGNIRPWATMTFYCDLPALGASWWMAKNWDAIQGNLVLAKKDIVDSWLASEKTTSKADLYTKQKNKDEYRNPGPRKTLGCFAFGNGAAWIVKGWSSGLMLLIR